MIGKYDEKRLTQQLAQALAATKAAEAGADEGIGLCKPLSGASRQLPRRGGACLLRRGHNLII